jgi:CBS domain-containing membrane protein
MKSKDVQLVSDLMTRDVATLQRNDQLSIADDVMRLGQVRHLPVLGDDDELEGIISHRDLLHGALARVLGYGSAGRAKLLKTVLVKEAMTCDPITVSPSTPIADAARLMVDKKIGCLLVVDGNALVGIVTESDFVRLHAAK